jgi:DNA-binding NtrC family response regulator/CheY-like chemotaxis protein
VEFPRILVIDDVFGASELGRNRKRENFCRSSGIRDITGDVETEEFSDAVAEGVFCRGQIESDGKVCNDLPGILKLVHEGWDRWPRWALILLDLEFSLQPSQNGEVAATRRGFDGSPDYFGLEILTALRRDPHLVDLPVVLLSAMERSDVEERISELQADDFRDKVDLRSPDAVRSLLLEHGLIQDNLQIGCSLSFLVCLKQARRRALRGNTNSLVLGETGTGKWLLADYIHRMSGRSGPFERFLVPAAPSTVIESELFGHEKGAFTGAGQRRRGVAERANGGTLFLDEFGDIPPDLQAKFLDLIDNNTRLIQPIGGGGSKKIDVQIVMATARNDALTSGYRNDLLARADVGHPIKLPPLRERPEDIMLLADHFLLLAERRSGTECHRRLSNESADLLINAKWGENVRGLELAIEYAVSTAGSLEMLSPHHFGRLSDQLPAQESEPDISPERTEETIVAAQGGADISRFGDLIRAIEAFQPSSSAVDELRGARQRCATALSRLLIRVAGAVTEAESRPTPSNPEGKLWYSRIAGWLDGRDYGREKGGSTRAKRLLLKLFEDVTDTSDLLKDPYVSKLGSSIGFSQPEDTASSAAPDEQQGE